MKKIYKEIDKNITKTKICLNVMKNYDKYKKLLGEQVRIIKNDGLEKYDKFIGKIGIVTSFEFVNFEKPLIITFFKGDGNPQQYCFGFDEIEKII